MSQKIICDGLCEPPATFPVEYDKQTEWRIMSRAISMPTASTSFHLCPSCWNVLTRLADGQTWSDAHSKDTRTLRFSKDASL